MRIPIRNVYYLLCYAWGHLEARDLVDVGELERMERVQDLLGKALAEGTFQLVRRGIDRGYKEVTREIPGVRGKLEVGAMAKRAVRARGRTVCTFEEFSPDVLHNRILRSSLDTLRRAESLEETVRADVALAYDKLEGIGTIRLSRQLFQRVQLDRNQRIYRFLLSICQLLHESLLIDEGDGAARFYDFRRDEELMWRVFEDFVAEFYRREQGLFRVRAQPVLRWSGTTHPNPSHGEFVPVMRPDLVLESRERRIVLDTKFYQEPLRAGRSGPKLKSSNLYQLVTYLENIQAARREGPRHDGILLYAAVGRALRVDVRLQGFRVQARTVDLGRPWTNVRRELLDILREPAKDLPVQPVPVIP